MRVVLELPDRGAADGGTWRRRECDLAPAALQPAPIETVLATLLNELSAISNDIVLVALGM